jgi:hypothetical protein
VAVQWFSFSNFKALPVDKDISQQEIVNFITLTMECGEISRSTGQFYWWRKPEYLEKHWLYMITWVGIVTSSM